MHAMQIIPLLGVFLMLRRELWLTEGHKVGLVWTVGAGYLGMVVLLTWQALRGQSIIAPDWITTLAAVAVSSAVLLSSIGIIVHARSRSTLLVQV
jgi:hypothetical protein